MASEKRHAALRLKVPKTEGVVSTGGQHQIAFLVVLCCTDSIGVTLVGAHGFKVKRFERLFRIKLQQADVHVFTAT